jgi:hypothetical protein
MLAAVNPAARTGAGQNSSPRGAHVLSPTAEQACRRQADQASVGTWVIMGVGCRFQ